MEAKVIKTKNQKQKKTTAAAKQRKSEAGRASGIG